LSGDFVWTVPLALQLGHGGVAPIDKRLLRRIIKQYRLIDTRQRYLVEDQPRLP
jgi:hypothetical protein